MLDGVSDGQLYGWAWDSSMPTVRHTLVVKVDGKKVASLVADEDRPDLQDAGIGDGRYGFQFTVPSKWADGRQHVVDVQDTDGASLPGSPWEGQLGTTGKGATVQATPNGFRSRFGGLWTDLSNARDLADGKAQLGLMTAEERALLEAFIDDGYVIIRGAVPLDVVEALRADVQGLRNENPDDVWVEVNGHQHRRLELADFRTRFKLLDLHRHYDSARRAMFAPRLARLLQLIFERPPLAFQSLYFERGIGQPLHCDTAYVKVSSPMEFAAAWIALEPIVAGSGELELYPRSHALPEKLFRGGRKSGPPPAHIYARQLRSRCRKAGLANERFIAQPGDVLVWAADLAHGGSRVLDKTLTRQSFVVHYCPLNVQPIYGAPHQPPIDLGSGTHHTYILH